jgi:Tol biopolymer transport system component
LSQSAGHSASVRFIRHRILVFCTVGLALVLAVAARSAGGSASPLVAGKSSLASAEPTGRVAYYWVDGGKRIVFDGQDDACSDPCLWIMDADGQHKRRLAPDAVLASVSPSGRLLARLDERRSRLIITTLAGKRARIFTFRASLGLPRLAWARDESAVAFEGQAARDRIYVAERRKGVRVIAQGPFLYGPAWSPDSRLLAFRRCPEVPPSYWRPRWPGCDLMVARRDGSHARLVARHTDTDDLFGGRFDAPLADPWSPNGRWLVFTRKFQIYVIHPDGSGLRRVRGTHNIPRRLAWSPDNKRLAYIAAGILVIPVQGGPEGRITTKTSQDTLSWAPSERILYSRRGTIWTVIPGQPPVAIR